MATWYTQRMAKASARLRAHECGVPHIVTAMEDRHSGSREVYLVKPLCLKKELHRKERIIYETA